MKELEEKVNQIVAEFQAFEPDKDKFEEQMDWIGQKQKEIYKLFTEHNVSPYITNMFLFDPSIWEYRRNNSVYEIRHITLVRLREDILHSLTYHLYRSSMGIN
jgi:hypothetical protein